MKLLLSPWQKICSLVKSLASKKTAIDRLKLGHAYGVVAGAYLGEIFVFISKTDSNLNFLSIPNLKVRIVPVSKFNYALKNRVIEYIERLPRNERKICKSQYEFITENETYN